VVIDPEKVSVLQVADDQIIHVTVEDNNSERAAQISNALVEVLIDQNNAAQSDRYSTYETALNSQIEDAKKQIASQQEQIQQIIEVSIQEQLTQANEQITQLKAEIAQLETETATLEQAIANFPVDLTIAERASRTEKISQLDKKKSLLSNYQQILANLIYDGKPSQNSTTSVDNRIASIQLALNLNQQTYLSLMDNLQILQLDRLQNTRTVTIIDPAVPPVEPIRPKPLLFILLAGIAGFMLAFGGILLQGYFDSTLKFSSDAEKLLGLSVLGTIPRQRQPIDGPIVAHDPTARSAQGFRKLGVVLELNNGEKPIQTLLVTSPGKAEGKTTVAANLASVFSRQGKRVLLIDANFSHPCLHILLGLNNEQGFAEILHYSKDKMRAGKDSGLPLNGIAAIRALSQYIAPQQYQNVGDSSFLVLPAGVSTQPDEFDQADKVGKSLNELKKLADLIILDAPPMSSANAPILAAQADAVLFVIKSGYTKIDSAVNAVQQLRCQGTQILGIVLNHSPEE
jgi:succinoglycan biosynthesis transport protein ExoP